MSHLIETMAHVGQTPWHQLGNALPKYMWPTVLHHVAEMPRNPNGKIDRKALSDRLA